MPRFRPRNEVFAAGHGGVKNAFVLPVCGQFDAASGEQKDSEPRWFGSAPRSVYLPPSPRAAIRTLKLPRRLADRRAPSQPIRLFFCASRSVAKGALKAQKIFAI
jgi:hypothetical protein